MFRDRDVEIHVFSEPGRYRLDMRSPAGDAGTHIHLDPAQFAANLPALRACVASARARDLGLNRPDPELPLQRLGADLFTALFAGETFRLLRSSRDEVERQHRTLRLVLRLPPELAVLPWELLFDDSSGEYFCHGSSLVRYVPVPERVRELAVQPPVRVLGMTSLPTDLAPLNAVEERRRVESALAGLVRRRLISLDWVEGDTWRAARDALVHGCHVFHFIGHGSFDPTSQQGSIFFADEHGHRRPVAATRLADLMRIPESPPRLVVLNSCQTAAGAPAETFSGIAAVLVRRIPAVVAMQFAISDDAATAFAEAFYTALVNGRGVDEAVRVARLDLRSFGDSFEWATPVLYLRSRDDDVFYAARQPPVDASAGDASQATGPPSVLVMPAQLPAAPAFFVGRHQELAALDARLAAGSRAGGRLLVLTIAGPGGIGKTALALRWAHAVRRRFPDGQLYVDLRGFGSGAAMDPAEAIRGFLNAFGVEDQHLPADLQARAALYRTVLANRRVLVVLDNAVDSAQVRPLLPGSAHAVVLVTSRNQLGGLLADGAVLVDLDYLPHADGRDLLTLRVGQAALDVDRSATAQVLDFCGGLPLALALVAARTQIRPEGSLASLRDELADEEQRLDQLSTGEPDSGLRAVFSWSYKALSDQTQRLFRLLGVSPAPDIGVYGAASLADLPVDAARAQLRELGGASLVDEPRPHRYRLHDLLRLYASAQADEVDSVEVRQQAVRRLLSYYLETGTLGRATLIGEPVSPRPGTGLATSLAGVRTVPITTAAEASAWFDAEDAALLVVTANLAAGDFADLLDRFAWAVDNVWIWRGRVHEVMSIWRSAVDAAQRRGDTTAQARAHRFLGLALLRLGTHDQARTHLERSLALFGTLNDPDGQAAAQLNLATVHDRQGDTHAAAELADAARRLHHAAGSRRGEAHALKAVGRYRAKLGAPVEALRDCARSLRIFHQTGDLDGQADALDDIGTIHQQLGRHRQARRVYERAMHLYGQVGDSYGSADTLVHLGDAQHAIGETDTAMVTWRQAAELFRAQGRHHQARSLETIVDRHRAPPKPPQVL